MISELVVEDAVLKLSTVPVLEPPAVFAYIKATIDLKPVEVLQAGVVSLSVAPVPSVVLKVDALPY